MKKLSCLLFLITVLIFPLKIKPGLFTLKPLTAKEQEAGVSESRFYTPGLDFTTLHKSGDTISEEFLEKFFLNTIFQYYIHEFLSFDQTYNYTMWQTYKEQKKDIKMEKYDRSKFKNIFVRLDLPEREIDSLNVDRIPQAALDNIWQIEAVKNAINALKQNKLLRTLGIAYQRTKIVVEKLHDKAKTTQDEEIGRVSYLEDRIATDLQAMIFYFIKEACEEYIERFTEARIKKEKDEAGKFLSTFKPSWLDEPYYKNIISNLDSLIKAQDVNDLLSFFLKDSMPMWKTIHTQYPKLQFPSFITLE
ncbi:TPA: hypothetical protein DIC20_05415 [Candidatus Dependentiae bacterium]|nr:MAG: hypothetical protein US03_C0005G0032 [candidate division TM6 bacterium GW2011_GWF2_36_131]KKQ03129.1 MAG: hypothetical protein US13_C0005G0013 [candidate division TM6 bacterium GW2011_GWE2_36_25]KKQ19383.1 MAG: hypothetical protein US32_C0010G0032 [candidate division TM6 bacterium GW2011_GWA2_36_9]HBR71030.1 hypothetical protein [Candidatus Dependentiae bacterium]HCU01104.1 hypothetical protein [Candidatus Dependentiae bacterium]